MAWFMAVWTIPPKMLMMSFALCEAAVWHQPLAPISAQNANTPFRIARPSLQLDL
jgi:hypothetical protein